MLRENLSADADSTPSTTSEPRAKLSESESPKSPGDITVPPSDLRLELDVFVERYVTPAFLAAIRADKDCLGLGLGLGLGLF